MSELLKVIMSNLKFKMATREAIRYLVEVAPKNASVRTWLYEHKQHWVETWLIVNPHEQVREATMHLIQSLVPGATPILDQKGDRIGVKMPEKLEDGDVRILHDLFRHLLSLLPAARRNTKGDQSLTTGKAPEDFPLAYWKLVQYFELLRWCVRSTAEKLIVCILSASLNASMPCTDFIHAVHRVLRRFCQRVHSTGQGTHRMR